MAAQRITLIVSESHFGNTVAVADAVAATLRAANVLTLVWMAHEAPLDIPEEIGLLLLVAPTHEGGLSTPATRKRAAGIGAKDSTDSRGVREWIVESVGGRDAHVVTLCTVDAAHADPGEYSAAEAAAELARERGFLAVERGPSFVVGGVAGPLAPGELRRARSWAVDLIRSMFLGGVDD